MDLNTEILPVALFKENTKQWLQNGKSNAIQINNIGKTLWEKTTEKFGIGVIIYIFF